MGLATGCDVGYYVWPLRTPYYKTDVPIKGVNLTESVWALTTESVPNNEVRVIRGSIALLYPRINLANLSLQQYILDWEKVNLEYVLIFSLQRTACILRTVNVNVRYATNVTNAHFDQAWNGNVHCERPQFVRGQGSGD